MTVKKEKTKKSKPVKTKRKTVTDKSKKQTKTNSKNKAANFGADAGIIVIEDDLTIDKDVVNEERRAYLEEARSQDASD